MTRSDPSLPVPASERRPSRRAHVLGTLTVLIIGGAVAAGGVVTAPKPPVATANIDDEWPLTTATRIALTAKEQSQSYWAQQAATKAGALTVGLSRRGDVVALFPSGEPLPKVPGIPGPGIRSAVSPFTRAHYREATRRINEVARRRRVSGTPHVITANYGYAHHISVDTGKILLSTGAPPDDVALLRRELSDIVVIRPGTGPVVQHDASA